MECKSDIFERLSPPVLRNCSLYCYFRGRYAWVDSLWLFLLRLTAFNLNADWPDSFAITDFSSEVFLESRQCFVWWAYCKVFRSIWSERSSNHVIGITWGKCVLRLPHWSESTTGWWNSSTLSLDSLDNHLSWHIELLRGVVWNELSSGKISTWFYKLLIMSLKSPVIVKSHVRYLFGVSEYIGRALSLLGILFDLLPIHDPVGLPWFLIDPLL